MARTFEDKPATREKVPVLVSIYGASGSGKTFSALRLATGIERAHPGNIFVIDTEAKRALHYADLFKFRHVDFSPPYGPLDYLDVINHCVNKGATTIVIDSFSHEHEGPGGVLEMHAEETRRLSGGDAQKAERVKMLAWSKPKSERRRLINTVVQLKCNVILLMRAKEKLKIAKKQEPEPLGYMPIGAEEAIFEMTLSCLLLPGNAGTPVWESEYPGERAMLKLPSQFVEIFKDSPQLTEDVGEKLAKWASGGAAPNASTAAAGARVNVDKVMALYDECITADQFAALEKERQSIWKTITRPDQVRLREAVDRCQAKLDEGARP